MVTQAPEPRQGPVRDKITRAELPKEEAERTETAEPYQEKRQEPEMASREQAETEIRGEQETDKTARIREKQILAAARKEETREKKTRIKSRGKKLPRSLRSH